MAKKKGKEQSNLAAYLLKNFEGGYNGDVDPSAGHTDPSSELVSQSN